MFTALENKTYIPVFLQYCSVLVVFVDAHVTLKHVGFYLLTDVFSRQ